MKNKGTITTLVLVFGAIFLLLLSGLLDFILLQLRQSAQRLAWNEALHIADAGVNYYRWCLNNESTEACVTEKDYTDPGGKIIGHFSLQIDMQTSCGQSNATEVISTGYLNQFPNVKRKVRALLARTSVAKYAYLLNDNVWAGADREIRGPYHSNGGIHMDGENQSLVTSSQQEWVCTSSFGCSSCPTNATPACRLEGSTCKCPGVFTTTSNSKPDLFESPVPPFDFAGITVDLAQMKQTAQTGGGVYLVPSNRNGYHLKFLDNGTFEVWVVTGVSPTYAYSLEEGWHYDYFTITSEYLSNTYSISSSCSVIFVEDNLWVNGKIRGKVTVASADLISPARQTDIVLPNNIEYTLLDGSDGLVLISERNILIGPQSPNQMELRGIFIAQNGHFGRNHYPNNVREKLEISGSIVSNGRVGTQWISGGQIISGYRKRENYFDPNLVYLPPPFVPSVIPDLEIVNWEEIE